jgi:hypothetical protein
MIDRSKYLKIPAVRVEARLSGQNPRPRFFEVEGKGGTILGAIEIQDDEIDVVAIMSQIEEKIRARRDGKTYSREAEDLIALPIHPSHTNQEDYHEDMYQVRSRWDVRVDYDLKSHRKVLGKILLMGRGLINGEVRRYVDPIIANQVEFNSHIANILGKIRGPDPKDEGIRDLRLFEGRMPVDAEEMLRHKKMLLGYFRGCKDVLALRLGRSDIVQLMEYEGINVSEVDLGMSDAASAKNGSGPGFSRRVQSSLESLNDNSLDGVFFDHVLQCLTLADQADLAKLCHRKMKPGAHLVSNGSNPTVASMLSLCRSAEDCDSPGSPVDPRTVKAMLESAGFRSVLIEFFDLPPEESRLSKLKIKDDAPEIEKENLEITNRNIMKLNSILFGPQSYSAIAER